MLFLPYFIPYLLIGQLALMRGQFHILPSLNNSPPPSLSSQPLLFLPSNIRLRKLLRRFVQAALGNFGGLPFHASRLITLLPASQA